MNYLILNKTQADSVRGIWGDHGIDPVLCPDGNYIIPESCVLNEYLSAVKSILQSINTKKTITDLPEIGGICQKDGLYRDDSTGKVVICVQTHNRTEHPVETIPALFSFFRENSDDLLWIENEYVELGWKRWYNGVQYEVIQKHQTLLTWTPVNTIGILWKSLAPATQDWAVGVAYNVNDMVIYLGKNYQCLQAHTSIASWNPVATLNVLWKLI